MPLFLCTLFFIILFACEAQWYDAKASCERRKLERYMEVEHPRRLRGDSYLDAEWY